MGRFSFYFLLIVAHSICGLSQSISTSKDSDHRQLALKPGVPQLIVLESSQTVEIFINGSLDINHKFWIFEAHTQYIDVGMSLKRPSPEDASTPIFVDNHPGVVVLRQNDTEFYPRAFLWSKIKDSNITVLLLVRGYSEDFPVPGLEDGSSVASPSLNLTWDENLIRLRFSEASHLAVTNTSSADEVYRYRVYQFYSEERDFDETNFFTQLANFLSPNDVISSGRLVADSFIHRNVSHRQNEVIFGAYPGTAAFFTVVVSTSMSFPNGTELTYSTVYVTTCTYSCNLDERLPLNCKVMWLTVTKVVCAVAVFVGVFISLVGHRYFQISQFFFGIFAGYFVGYIIVENFANMSFTGTLGISSGVAVIFAILWSCVWFFCGIPLLATVLPTAVLGLLCGCALVFIPSLNTASLMSDSTYWACILAFTIGIPLFLLGFTQSASILSCAVVGTYAIVTPIDHYIGSSLKYILVNAVRRATVEDFNLAVTYFPFQANDTALLFGWIGLIVVSCIVQRFRERNRAPFPPNMYLQWRWRHENDSLSENAENTATESTPLLFSRNQDRYDSGEREVTSSPRRPQAPRPPTAPSQTGTPVVGYIEGYGSTVPSPVYRAVQMPEFYERRVTSNNVQMRASSSFKRQSHSANTHDESDIFRPPDEIN